MPKNFNKNFMTNINSPLLGWYYLHTNGDLIYKSDSKGTLQDIQGSNFCTALWPWSGERDMAWEILVTALSLGANKKRIQELAKKWECTNKDAKEFAEFVGCDLGWDGDKCYARRKDFINLQESPCGFGDNYLEAMADLCKKLGYKNDKKNLYSFGKMLK